MPSPSTAEMIRLDQVSLSLPSRAGSVEILNDLSLSITAGGTVAMLRP